MTLPSKKQTLFETTHPSAITGNNEGVLHILISDRNKKYFNDDGYNRLAAWAEEKKFKKIIIYSTGTLQLDSMMLDAELAGHTATQENTLKKGFAIEKQTRTKILKSFDRFKQNGFKIIRIEDEKDHNASQLKRTNPRKKEEQLLKRIQQLKTKAAELPENEQKQKATLAAQELVEEQKAMRRLNESQTLSKTVILSHEFDFSHFFLNPLLSHSTQEDAFILYMPWSAIAFDTTNEYECYYKNLRALHFEILSTEKHWYFTFDNLVTKIARDRLEHFYINNKINSENKSAWITARLPLAKNKVASYLLKEIPFFIILMISALKIHADTKQISYLCYPMKSTLGTEVFEYVTNLCAHPCLGLNHKEYFNYVDTTDLLLEKESPHTEQANPASTNSVMTSKRQCLYLISQEESLSMQFTLFLLNASERMIENMWEYKQYMACLSEFDEEVTFFRWLDKNELSIPPAFKKIKPNQSDVLINLHLLASPKGIHYLDRACLPLPASNRQRRVNEIFQQPQAQLRTDILNPGARNRLCSEIHRYFFFSQQKTNPIVHKKPQIRTKTSTIL